ncbi:MULTISPECIES: FHA domain-containing protein [Calothrix]|uniref:FHA domain-containing protein n=2 Tax=Calothrix TaxID=1186 RepID=A0ABR8A571_9CYAN|nr:MULTISPECIES: FHA domain-containing protein [Calothrix]MBD2194964.1 FHA domain-containing protein [Calothrix parietina FACHB-288]MBD2223562.1 FHA domain-containing protein [Calothrix anomala FACHB-343]
MIVCPNCNHPNPDGAVQCEACYTPLPATNNCPNCGATVQADAAFCGQCGYNLRANAAAPPTAVAATVAPDIPLEVPPLVTPDPLVELVQPDPLAVPNPVAASPLPPTAVAVPPEVPVAPVAPPPVAPPPVAPPPVVPVAVEITPASEPVAAVPEPVAVIPEPEPVAVIPEPEPVAAIPEPEPVAEIPEPEPVAAVPPAPAVSPARTQLQQITAQLFHVQSDTNIELPQTLSVIHIGKPNDRIPPDVDVSGFPNSEIVSRIHSDIRVEGDAFYIEDVGSSNGTYINNLPLLPGNRHRLRPGDRISLGKGDLVTFLFQLS